MNTFNEVLTESVYLGKIRTEKYGSHLSKRFNSIGRARRFEEVDDRDSPGPGLYYPKQLAREKITSFTKCPREFCLGKSDSPGPGSYTLPKIRGKSFSFAAKLQQKNNDVPGPGEYTSNFSKFRSKAAIFGSEVRKDNFLNPELSKNPEPWKYNTKFRDASPSWKFSTSPRSKEFDISKLGVFEAISLLNTSKSKIS